MNTKPPPRPAVKQAMAIAAQYKDKPGDKAAMMVAAQIRMFWDPHMQKLLRDGIAAGEVDDPVILQAVDLI